MSKIDRRVSTRLVAMVLVIGTAAVQTSPAAVSDRQRESFVKPWHINIPRPVMLAAWERVKKIEIAGVDLDQRFKIDATAFYVSPSGDDAAEGSKEHPWKTLRYAAGMLRPGTVTYLMTGTYSGPIQINAKCIEQAPAALRAMPGQEAIITYDEPFIQQQRTLIASIGKEGAIGADGKSLHYPSLITISGTYVEVSGLHLVGARDRLPMNLYSESGISLAGRGGEGCRVLYNEVENTGHCGVKEMGHGGSHFLIEGNYIHDIGHTAHDHGIYMPADDVVIRKNILINSAGWGVHAYTTPKRLSICHNIIGGNAEDAVILGGSECRVFNNVFYKDNKGGAFFFRRGCRNNTVINNIIVEPVAFRFDSMGSQAPADQPQGNVIDYNCIPGRMNAPSPPGTIGSHNITADPRFVDAPNLDFHLQPASPCRGCGQGGDIGLQSPK